MPTRTLLHDQRPRDLQVGDEIALNRETVATIKHVWHTDDATWVDVGFWYSLKIDSFSRINVARVVEV